MSCNKCEKKEKPTKMPYNFSKRCGSYPRKVSTIRLATVVQQHENKGVETSTYEQLCERIVKHV